MAQLQALSPNSPDEHVLLAFSALTGVVIHLTVFIHGEWHLKCPRLIFGHLSVVALLQYILSKTHVYDTHPVKIALKMFGAYLVSLYSSIVVYRLFFHRLKNFSGPPLAKVSKLWHASKCIDRRNYLVFQGMYEQYGEFVRSGPNEISVFRPGAIEIIDAHKNKTVKSEWYDVLHPRSSAVFVRDPVEHSKRRRLWSQAMSTKAIETYLPRIVRQVDTLSELVASYDSKPLLVNDVMAYFSFDSMGEFMFNEDFGMMKSTQWHPKILQQKRALAMLGVMNEVIWAVRIAFFFTPWFGHVKDWLDMEKFCVKQMDKRLEMKEKQNDIAAWFIKEYNDNKVDTLEKRKDILGGNVITAIVAGSDTTRPSLIAVWYFLAKHPEHQEKILKELADVDVTDANRLASLPHMNACINESMRLMPAAMTGATRYTPPEGLTIDGTWIPGNTKVASPRYCILRLPTAFVEPDSFVPERWTTRPEMVIDHRAFAPFGSGPRRCIGMNLAMTEIRLVTANLVKRFEVSFPPDFDVSSVERELRDQVTAQPGECWASFKPRMDVCEY